MKTTIFSLKSKLQKKITLNAYYLLLVNIIELQSPKLLGYSLLLTFIFWFPNFTYSQDQNDITSKNVSRVEFQDSYFQKLTSAQSASGSWWVESNQSGTNHFLEYDGGNHQTTSSTESSVFLFDPIRLMFIELNILEKWIKIMNVTDIEHENWQRITAIQAGYVPNVSKMIAKPGKYYKLELKTNSDYALRVWDNGFIGSTSEKSITDYSKWLLIPTGEIDTYWIFNKGAQDGVGQLLTQPDGRAQYLQWDFNENDDRQKYKLVLESDGYFRIIQKGTNNAVSTRWNEMAFAHGVNLTDDSQLFKLVEAGDVKDTDAMPGYIFWNFDNSPIKNYFKEYYKKVPNPSKIRIKKISIVNQSSKAISIAISKFGCAGLFWHDGIPQCDFKTIRDGYDWTTGVSDYLNNSEEIWSVIGWTSAILGGIAVGVVSVVFAPAVASSALGLGSASSAAAVTIGHTMASAAITLIDLVVFTHTMPRFVYAAKELAENDDLVVSELNSQGVNDEKIAWLEENLGGDYFYAGNTISDQLLKGWHFKELTTRTKITDLFYGNGQLVFIIDDKILGR